MYVTLAAGVGMVYFLGQPFPSTPLAGLETP
jgi:hypothetical protein